MRSGSVDVIDGSTNRVQVVEIGTPPGDLVINMATNTIYVGCMGTREGKVAIIDGATNKVRATVDSGCTHLVIDQDSNQIYAASTFPGSAWVIDGDSHTASAIGPLSFGTTIELNPSSHKVYYGNSKLRGESGPDEVLVLNGHTKELRNVPVGKHPSQISVNPVANKIYVINHEANTLTVIDGDSNATITLPVGEGPEMMVVNPLTNKIYVANADSNSVTVIDGAALTGMAGVKPQ